MRQRDAEGDDMLLVAAFLIVAASVAVVGVVAWRRHPNQRFWRTRRQIRSLPERERERSLL